MSGDVPAASGILPAQAITALTQAGAICPATSYAADQIQPASLDLRLGRRAYRVRTSFL
ncbi:MAG: 2'-deoxycytidine 5'-triphosphate deaminase, partial [Methylobacteriaceae bacterium]